MRIDIITVLPEMLEGFFNESILARAQKKSYRAGRVVRPYKAEQEPCKYGKAPLQLCRRGASAYTQSSMLLRSTATSKGAAVASLI